MWIIICCKVTEVCISKLFFLMMDLLNLETPFRKSWLRPCELYPNRTYAMCNFEYYVARFIKIVVFREIPIWSTYFSKCGSSLLESSYVHQIHSISRVVSWLMFLMYSWLNAKWMANTALATLLFFDSKLLTSRFVTKATPIGLIDSKWHN